MASAATNLAGNFSAAGNGGARQTVTCAGGCVAEAPGKGAFFTAAQHDRGDRYGGGGLQFPSYLVVNERVRLYRALILSIEGPSLQV